MTDKDLQEQMAQFEAARITSPVELQPQTVSKVVAVHDRTDQDATVDALAKAVAAAHATGATPTPLE